MARALGVFFVVTFVLTAKPALGLQLPSLSGHVTDTSTGKPVRNAQVIVLADSRSVSTDSSGHFVITALPQGESRLLVRAPFFPARLLTVTLAAGENAERAIALDSTAFGRLAAAQSLPTVDVSAPAQPFNYRLAGFERRKLTGRGQYLSEEDILRSGAYTLADAVKNLRGVLYECGGGAGCYVRMARAPLRCIPEYVVDDVTMNDFGPVTPIRDIIAIEVYIGPTDLPGEWAGRNGGCGVIAVYTRSGPTRKKK